MAARGMDQLILDMKIQNDMAEAYENKLRILNEDLERIDRKKLAIEGEISRMAGVLEVNAEDLRHTTTAIQNMLVEGIDIRSLRDSKIVMDLHKLGFIGFRVTISPSIQPERIDEMGQAFSNIGVPFTYWRPEYMNLSEDHLRAELNAHQSHVIFMRGVQRLAPHQEVFSQAVMGLFAESRKREVQQDRRKRKSVEEKFESFDHWRAKK